MEAPLWLDPQRYASLGLERLGHDAARNTVLREVGALLARAALADLTFNDGTPLADPVTKDWIENEVKPVLGAGAGGSAGPRVSGLEAKMNDARAMVTNGPCPTPWRSSRSWRWGRRRPWSGCVASSAWRSCVFKASSFWCCSRAGRGAGPSGGEPPAVGVGAAAVRAVLRGPLPGSPRCQPGAWRRGVAELRAKEAAAFERLCQLDAGAALKFTLGG